MPQTTEPTTDIHVLTITPFFPSRENDVNGCFIAEPIAELEKFGIRSTVIAVSPIHYQKRHSHSSAEATWIRYPQVPGVIGLSTAGNLLYRRLRRMVRSIHNRASIDVIHAHAALPCGHAAMLLSGDLKIPFVVTVHGLDVFNTCSRPGIAAAGRRKVSSDIYRAARNVICISRKVEEVLKAGMSAGVASTVVHNGVDPITFSPGVSGAQQTDFEILAVGSLLPSKGQELVLRALEKLKSRFPRVRCRIVGEGPDRERLEALVRNLPLSSQVEFVSRQSRVELANAMRRCSIFALPSWNEGLGCVYLEAMACAKPVIGCAGQGIEDVIEHGRNGWLVPRQALDKLVEALATLLASHELRSRIGDSARQIVVEKFTLSHQAQRLAGVYRRAVEVLPPPIVEAAAL
jgi:teichuronic acid biosynthesis glycosyltransferase TuaC